MWSKLGRWTEPRAEALRRRYGPTRSAPEVLLFALATALLTVVAAFTAITIIHISVLILPLLVSVCLFWWMTLYLFFQRYARVLSAPAQLDRMASKSFEQYRFAATIAPARIRRHVYRAPLLPAIAALVVAVIILVLFRQATGGVFAPVRWGPWRVPAVVCATSSGAIILLWAIALHYWFDLTTRLQSVVNGQICCILQPLNTEIDVIHQEWAELLLELDALSQSLGIIRQTVVLESTLHSLGSRTEDILQCAQMVYANLREAMAAARSDRSELDASLRLYRRLRDTATAEATAVRNGPAILREEVARYSAALDSREAREFLQSRNWAGYRVLAEASCQNIGRIPALAHAFTLERVPSPPATAANPNETDVEKAYRILRLPARASAEDVQRAYRWLSSLWHPDRNLVSSDDEMKAINWAYAYLRNSGRS